MSPPSHLPHFALELITHMSKTLVRVRAATRNDYALWARLVGELGTGDPPFSQEKWEQRILSGMFVGEEASTGEACAYVYFQVLTSTGYIRNLVVAPTHRARGIGRAMLRHVAAHLRASGIAQWELNVLPGNAPAIALYSSVGMAPTGHGTAIRFAWRAIDALAEHAPPVALAVRAFEAADDAALERRFRLIDGQLDDSRRRGLLTLALCAPDGACAADARGVACFDASFPGCAVFRLSHALDARALLVGVRERALPSPAAPASPWVQVFVEDDVALVAHLLALDGAEVKMRTLRMRGSLESGAADAAAADSEPIAADSAPSAAEAAVAALSGTGP
jgi:ribosomal protein S18 acetylase RimI-like enzyme